MTKMLIATADAFSKDAVYITKGQVIPASSVDWKEGDAGFIAAPADVDAGAVVGEVADLVKVHITDAAKPAKK